MTTITNADIDAALDALDEDTERATTREEPDAGSSGAPAIPPPPRPMDEQLGDAAHTLRLIARRIEAYRRAAAC